jgi:hypothetical protein
MQQMLLKDILQSDNFGEIYIFIYFQDCSIAAKDGG